MEGIIPLEEEQDTYDDCLPLNTASIPASSSASIPAAIDDDIYEELPGLASYIY